jgi:YegS/Rv2252/BmrU family lipid kinase
MKRKIFYIVNPNSSNGKTKGIWQKILKELEGTLGKIDYAFTEFTMHAAELANKALKSGYTTIVAVGGDGTLNEALNGFFSRGKPVRENAEIGFIPSSTGGDTARSLGIRHYPRKDLLLKMLTGKSLLLDFATAHFRDSEGAKTTRHFINELSAGFSANIAQFVNRSTKMVGGKASFFLGVFRCLSSLKNRVMEIIVDGKPWYTGPTFITAVCNGKYFGGSMKVAPQAVLDDGKLDIILIKHFTRRDVIHHIGKIYTGEHLDLPQVSTVRASSVRITSLEEVPLEMDGEQPGILEVSIEVNHRGINFLVPAEV